MPAKAMDVVCFRGMSFFEQRQDIDFPQPSLSSVEYLEKDIQFDHEIRAHMIHYNTFTVSEKYVTLHVLYCTNPAIHLPTFVHTLSHIFYIDCIHTCMLVLPPPPPPKLWASAKSFAVGNERGLGPEV